MRREPQTLSQGTQFLGHFLRIASLGPIQDEKRPCSAGTLRVLHVENLVSRERSMPLHI